MAFNGFSEYRETRLSLHLGILHWEQCLNLQLGILQCETCLSLQLGILQTIRHLRLVQYLINYVFYTEFTIRCFTNT